MQIETANSKILNNVFVAAMTPFASCFCPLALSLLGEQEIIEVQEVVNCIGKATFYWGQTIVEISSNIPYNKYHL